MTAHIPTRLAATVIALSMLILQAQAQDKPGTEFMPASGLGNWTYDYDVSGLKPGTYNILARAVDSAGNTSFATPFNLIVDPASDLPVVSIVNPLPLARVGADLNIVGTCVDDDAVSYVEIRLDEGEWQRARGADFWSQYLPTSGIADGSHQLSARGVDSNGLAGLESKVSFNLDRTKPLHTIAKPSFGAIVSRRITIQGSVFDANGLASVAWSADSGSTWQPLRYSYDKKSGTASFDVAVDTNKLPDGPTVLWLRSVDRVGSESIAVFLYFVDNTKAELAIISPGDEEAVNGRFSITGRVYDTVGIASLEWSRDKETGRVELLPGNPYFSIPVEAPAKAGPLTIRLTATDVAGNVSTLAVTRRVDPGADLPTVALSYPATGAAIDGSLFAAGGARDDDGVSSVAWRIDEGPETTIETKGSFSFRADDLAGGTHVLWVRATDVNGLPGLWIRTPFTYSGKAPRVSLLRAVDTSGERDFRPGVSLSTMEGKATISGTVEAANPLVELSYTINGGAAAKLPFSKTENGASFTVPLSASLPWGVLDLEVSAVDSSGKTGLARAPVLAIDWSRPRVGPLLDFGIAGESSQEKPAIIALSDAAPLSGTFVTPFDGEDIASVRLEPASSIVEASFEGATVSIKRSGEGSTAPTSVMVTTLRGHSFSSGPYVFTSDTVPPSLSISEPAFGSWLRGTVLIAAQAEDGDRVASVEYSANGGPWSTLEKAGPVYSGSFDASALDGPVRLDVRASDAAGNTATASTAFMADTQAPQPVRLLPKDGDSVGGPTLFVIKTGGSAQSLSSVELGRAGAFQPLEAGSIVSFTSEPSAAPLVLRVRDKAGNIAELDPLAGLVVEAAARKAPQALASIKSNSQAVPAGLEGPVVTIAGADAVGALSWTSPFIEGGAIDESAFPAWATTPIRASGAMSLSATFTGLAPDPKKPVASWGWAPDATNQALALKPDKTGGWTAAIKAPARPDGNAMLWVRITDTGRGELLSRIALDYDSTPATIELVSPLPAGAKASSAGPFTLVVRATDSTGIALLSYEAGADKGDFETAPGSGDAVKTFAFPPKASSLSMTIRAVDGSGNRSSSSLVVAYDLAADTPAVSFVVPADGETLADDGQAISAILYARDDDAAAGVSMSLDSAAFSAEGPGPLYAIDLGRPAPGKRSGSATATDSGGLESSKSTISFARAGLAPTLRFDAPLPAAGSSMVADGKSAIVASIVAPNGLARVEYSFNGAARAAMTVPKPGADGAYALRVTLPTTLPMDRCTLAVTATDSAGAATTASTSFHRVAALKPGAAASAEGVYLYDPRLQEGKPTSLSPGDVIGALWLGRPIASVRLEPARAFLAVSFEGEAVTISAVTDGGAEPGAPETRLVVETVDGDVFRSQALALRVDSSAPELAILEPLPGAAVRGSFLVGGTATDPNGIAAVEWSTDGGSSWTPFEPGVAAFSGTVSPVAADGPTGILVRATDRAGNSSVAQSSVSIDVEPPRFVFESPRQTDTVNGTILVSAYVSDGSPVASVAFSPDGVAWETLEASARGSAPKEAAPEEKAQAGSPAPLLVAFSRIVDLGALPEGGGAMAFRSVDSSGNEAIARPLDPTSPAFTVDIAADKPRLQIQIPAEGEVARADFVVSGMAFDDDGVAELFWRLDGGAWTGLAGSNGFSVPFRLLDLADNEHVFEAYAVDLNGVQGEVAARAFKVSREEPVGRLESPDVEFTNKGIVDLRGVASDANGVSGVAVSFDNGATYNTAVGTTEWSYRLDSRTLPDGVHSVYVKLLDSYETPGFAAGLLSVDNSPPVIRMDTPADGDESLGSVIVGGRVSDGLAVQKLSLEISRIGSSTPLMVVDLPTNGVFSTAVDISALEPGWYNLKAVALDKAGNDSYDSRNIVVLEAAKADYAELVFPAHGERLSGHFTLDGRVVSSQPVERVAITLGGAPFAVVETKAGGWFSLAVATESLADGDLTFGVEAVSASGAKMASEPRTVSWTRDGPWVDIDALVSGDFVIGRPYLSGKAGWDTPEPADMDKKAAAEYKALAASRRVEKVELSRDNGKTWAEASGGQAFKFRLETQEYPNGALRLLARATFANGETAVRKRLVVLDTKAPTVTILRPSDNGRYNGVISIEGTAYDDNGLAQVAVVVRSGDKSSYEVPGFIQGSYLDVHLLGATRFEAGLGLSFFDDNVKLQVELGQGFDAQPSWDNLFGVATSSTPAAEISRFGGYVLGARLLANLAYLPFSYWFGPDWDFFSMSFAVGASFTYFSQMDAIGSIFSPPDGKYMVLSGVVGQWEFAKFDFGWSVLKTFGFYLEGGLVFIPSEASTSLEEFIRPNVGLGLRIGLF